MFVGKLKAPWPSGVEGMDKEVVCDSREECCHFSLATLPSYL